MKLTIRWRDGDKEAEAILDAEFEDGDVIDLRGMPQELGDFVGDAATGQIWQVPSPGAVN